MHHKGILGNRKGLAGWIIVVIIIAALALIGGGVYLYSLLSGNMRESAIDKALNDENFYQGIRIDGVDVGGRSYDDVLEEMLAREKPIRDSVLITLTFEDQNFQLTESSIPLTFNTEQVVQEAYNLYREGDRQERYDNIQKLKEEGKDFEITYTVDPEPAKAEVQKILDGLEIEAVNASVASFTPDAENKFTFTEGTPGRAGDLDAIYQQVEALINSQNFGGTVAIEMKTVEPEVTKADLEKNTALVSQYKTALHGTANRITNIKLCSSAFNGKVVAPGETFSINDTTGPRTSDKGYRPASVIQNGEMVDEPGGGVCQVSSTLYNAVLMADLEIVERHHHSLVSSYVPIGMDATINYPNLDLKFKNDKETPIYLASYIKDGYLYVEVYGEPLPDGMTIEVYSELVSTFSGGEPKITVDESLKPGEKVTVVKARTGKKSKTYVRYLDKDGKVIKTEMIHEDTYPAARGQYRVGPDATPTPKPTNKPVTTDTPIATPTETPVDTPFETPAADPPQEAGEE